MVAGFAILCLAATMFVVSYLQIAEWTTIAGLALIVIAGILCLPSIIRPVSACLFAFIRPLYPVEAQLGQQQLLDNFGRTSLTIAVLFVVSATSVSIGNTSLMITGDVTSWLDRTLTADFLLRASRPRVDMSEADSIPDEVEEQLGLIPGIESIDRVSFSVASVNGTTATLMVRELSSHNVIPVDIVEGNPADVEQGMLSGEAVIGTMLASRMKIKLHDTMRMEVAGISHSVRVAGIVKEYTAGGLMVIMDREAASLVYPIEPAQVFGIRCSPESTAEVGTQLQSLCRDQGLIFQSLEDLRELVRSMINGLMTRLWLILIMALIIAGFAIINTLTMSVIEQTRHLGMLRVVGMSRLQVFRMFLFQAMVLSLLALLPGTLVGVLLAYLITVSFGGVAEYSLTFAVHPLLLLCYVASGVLLSLVAAALPAIRAGRLKPLEAIHQE